jgi:hypothetical protein
MKSIAVTYTPHVTKAIAALAAVTVLALFLYGFFLLEAVANTAKRADAEKGVSELTSRISGLEAQYLADTENLTPEQAQSLGYETPTDITTVYAGTASQALGYNASH